MMSAEQVAIDHLSYRRSRGWSLADCRSEARLCAAMRGLPDNMPMVTWDDLVVVMAQCWEELPRAGQQQGGRIMSDDLPSPPIPTGADLRDFPFTPMFRSRLFGSSFHARVSDAGWRAGVTLWLKSWDQSPAGSLPDDDIDLCRLAELGRDLKSWRKSPLGMVQMLGRPALS
jgi:hypothetical protein